MKNKLLNMIFENKPSKICISTLYSIIGLNSPKIQLNEYDDIVIFDELSQITLIEKDINDVYFDKEEMSLVVCLNCLQ
jgi:hypothetical protein